MAQLTGRETRYDGGYGNAVIVPVPDTPQASETVCTWLLTAPYASPAWSQYNLVVVRLRDDAPGFPPPARHFPGSTHELLVVALDPDHGPYTAENMSRFHDGSLPFLTPVNVVHQLEGTDDEASMLAAYAAWGVTAGVLSPEPAVPRPSDWDIALVKTLAHIRGEQHAP